jgi:hypothetical protein
MADAPFDKSLPYFNIKQHREEFSEGLPSLLAEARSE